MGYRVRQFLYLVGLVSLSPFIRTGASPPEAVRQSASAKAPRAVFGDIEARQVVDVGVAPTPVKNRIDTRQADGVAESNDASFPSAVAGACPGAGDCCVANGTPGCADTSCCDLVCAQDPFCCSAGWDSLCVDLADSLCGDLCSGSSDCPGAGSCCQANGSPGCNDQLCCDLVCEDDPFCCDAANGWDALCVSKAEALCGALCTGESCPGVGDCCQATGTPGCVDQTCCELVCADDPNCCDLAGGWDALCASRAHSLCVELCSSVNCPGNGDCCQPNGTAGCSEPTCCDLVCTDDPACCDPGTGWDTPCVAKAQALCGPLCSCPGQGDCCQVNGTAGCSEPTCCDLVCTDDPTCCDPATGWGSACVAKAQALCGPLCSCPGQGDCCQVNGTAGCSEPTCCDLVCTDDPTCCDPATGWGSACVAKAQALCGPLCSCPGQGDCCQANGSPGCNDQLCCDLVCEDDPFCCDAANGWDALCVSKAEALCGALCTGESCPGVGDCCQATGTPGCVDQTCCELVCADDPNCCDLAGGWDALCASRAHSLCVELCSSVNCPGNGDCCQPNGTAGCTDPTCCDLVCTDDPTCCDPGTGWDSLCAQSAQDLCNVCNNEACCFVNGSCADLATASCVDQDGTPLGPGSVCNGACENAIPTVSEWGVSVMCLLLLTAGTLAIVLRRHHVSQTE